TDDIGLVRRLRLQLAALVGELTAHCRQRHAQSLGEDGRRELHRMLVQLRALALLGEILVAGDRSALCVDAVDQSQRAEVHLAPSPDMAASFSERPLPDVLPVDAEPSQLLVDDHLPLLQFYRTNVPTDGKYTSPGPMSCATASSSSLNRTHSLSR